MTVVARVLVALVALLHLGFLTLEMVLWTKPAGRQVFGLDRDFAEETKALAYPSRFVIFDQSDALGLVREAPALGIGRGSFVDAFPLADTRPGPILFTHLESAPVAMIVEWGPVGGGVILLGLTLWWIAAFWDAETGARRVALLGLLALALHSTVDFSLEYLGVAAPAVALAGALSPTVDWRLPRGRGIALAVALTLLGAGLGLLGGPHGLVGRRGQNEAVARGELSGELALARRPLDAQLHLRLARQAAEAEDWGALAHHAEVITWLNPTTVEGWLMRASVASRGGSAEDADAHLRRALVNLRQPPDATFVAHLTSLADPDTLARLAPVEGEAWTHLMNGLLNHAPDHVDAVARAREAQRPFDADALRYRARAALILERPLLALHLARLLRDSAPDRAESWQLLVRARSAVGGPDTDADVQRELREALRAPDRLDDPGVVEELLLASLVRTARSREELQAALELGERLLTRQASREDLRRRERRVVGLKERLGQR